jgi:hypothetical protein
VITHGVSGSGKTHIARVLCERLGWIHLRSDVERLRLFGRWGPEPVAVLDGDPYRPEVSDRIYGQRLVACAEAVLAAGLSVIVDATFLRRRDRLRMGAVAADARSGFAILECRCSVDQARRRIGERRRGGGDPSEADESVLEQQLITQEPLAAEEIPFLISVPTDQSGPQDGFDSLLRRLRTIPARLPP